MEFYELPELDFDPCCGCMPLQKGVKIIAIVDLIMAVISSASCFLLLFLIVTDGKDLADAAETDRADFPAFADLMQLGVGGAALIVFAFMVQSLIYIFLARFLLHGAMERNYEKMHLWYSVTVVLVAIRFIYYIIGLLMSSTFFIMSFFGLIGFFYTIYSLFVVSAFKYELKRSGESCKLRDAYHHHHQNPVYSL